MSEYTLIEREEGLKDLPEPKSAQKVDSEPPRDNLIRQQTVAEVLQVPSSMFATIEKDLVDFLDYEIEHAEAERHEMMEKFARWKVVYAAPMKQEPKHWPIYNSSNLTVPVVKELVNTLAGQLAQMTLTARPYWILKDLAAEWEPFIDEVEQFLDTTAVRDLKFRSTLTPWIIEMAKMGTGLMEVGHKVDVRSNYKYNTAGDKVYKSSITHHDGPHIQRIPVQRWWSRAAETGPIDSMRWCGVELDMTWQQLKEGAVAGKFKNLDKLRGHQYHWKRNRVDQVMDRIVGQEPINYDRFQIFALRMLWDVDNDHMFEELKVYYSYDAKAIIGCQFNPYWHGRRGIVKIGYFPREDRFWDEGLCEMLEDIQAGVTDKQNKRADNEAMANVKMILKRRMLKTLQPGDPLYTGKIIDVNDIWNDVREFNLSEIYPSTINEEQILRNYADRLVGSNEGSAGAAMPVTRTTASAQLALLEEQRGRQGLVQSSVREGIDEIGQLVASLLHQFGTNGKALAWMGERGRIVEAIFRLPRRAQELGLAMQASTPTSTLNRQVKQESSIQLLNLLIQVYEKLWPFAQALAPQAMGQVAHGFVHSARKYLTDVLESFESTDPEDVLAGLTILEKVLPAPEDIGGGMEDFLRRAQSSETLDQFTRMEAILEEATTTSRRGERKLSNGNNGRRLAPPPRIPGRSIPDLGIGGEPR